jgi:hypothetical protein
MLWRLKDTLLEVPTRPVQPTVCYALPFAVDLTRAQATPIVVDIYGYDFDATTLQLVVVTRNGFLDVTPNLTVKSHTHLTAIVGGSGVPASTSNQSLGVAWGHVIHYRVPLVDPATRVCSSRVETIPPGRTVVYGDGVGVNSLRAASGPDVGAEMHLDYSSNLLQAILCVTAADATASGCISEFLYTTDPDRVIDGVLGPLSSQVSFAHGGRTATVGVRRGLVRRWTADSTSVVARLDGIRLVSSDAEDCISAVAYLEAKRTTAFSQPTAQALDAQLTRVEASILKVRPRFAPPSTALRPVDAQNPEAKTLINAANDHLEGRGVDRTIVSLRPRFAPSNSR